MAKTYTPQALNDATQFPTDVTFTAGKAENRPYGFVIPSFAIADAPVTDTQACQIAYDSAAGKLMISPIGASTFTALITKD